MFLPENIISTDLHKMSQAGANQRVFQENKIYTFKINLFSF